MDGSPIPTINGNVYNKIFQYNLLAHLVKSEELLKSSVDKLQTSDFELGVCQVVWEAIQEYYTAYKQLPTPQLFQLTVTKVVHNSDGQYKSYITPEETEALCSLMEFIDGVSETNPDFFRSELPKYIKWVRSSRTISQFKQGLDQGADASHMIEQLAVIQKETSGMLATDNFRYVTEQPNMLLETHDELRVTTGCGKLDAALDKGPRPGEIGCITACPGTGKTNTLLHLAVSAASVYIDNLVFSLELPGPKMSRRYMAMLAGIPAQLTKKGMAEWPEPDLMRFAMVTDPRYPAANKTVIIDASQGKISCAKIEDTIGRWKEHTVKLTGTCKNNLLVCIDWLKYILWPTAGKKDEWAVLTDVCQELGFIAKRQGVVIWTANQGKAEADGKTLLRMKDMAFAYHINDALDISIGLALSANSRVTEEDLTNNRVKSRNLMFNINKSRDNDIAACELFQAPTLRFFDSEPMYNSYNHKLKSIAYDPRALHRASIPQHIQQLYALKEDDTDEQQFRTSATG